MSKCRDINANEFDQYNKSVVSIHKKTNTNIIKNCITTSKSLVSDPDSY